jgi:uncharacterized RDD family membrane protein YckC
MSSTTGSVADRVSAEEPAAYAGFWLRVAAILIDCGAMFIPYCFLAFVAVVVSRLVSASKGYDSGLAILAVLPTVTVLAAYFYFAVMESSFLQGTVGKRVLGLCVTDINGHRLTLRRALGRNVAKLLTTLSLGIGFAICGFTHKKQALHDIIANCLVLRRPR